MATLSSTICLTAADVERVLGNEHRELFTLASAPYLAVLTQVRFEAITVLALQESTGRLAFKALSSQSVVVQFPTRPGFVLTVDGMTVPFGAMLSHPVGHRYYERTSADADIGVIVIPTDRWVATWGVLDHSRVAPPPVPLLLTPPPSAFARLLQLHKAIEAQARSGVNVGAGATGLRSLEMQLRIALLECTAGSVVTAPTFGQISRSRVMQRVRNALRASRGEPVDLAQLCAAAGVAERTLRICCQEHLGMGPKRYLMLRNLHLARQALQGAGPLGTTVTQVAMQFGFWHLGRFSSGPEPCSTNCPRPRSPLAGPAELSSAFRPPPATAQ